MKHLVRTLRWPALSFSCLLLAFGPTTGQAQTVTGRITEAESDTPVQEAVVVLLTPTGERVRSTQTDSLGRYSLVNLDPATYAIKSRRVGYEESRGGPFSLPAGDTLAINLTLTPKPVAMEEVTVEADVKRRLRDVGFYKRQENTSGYFLNRADVKETDTSVPSELFRSVQGIKMSGQVGQAVGAKPFIQATGRTTIVKGRNDKPCIPAIVIDGSVARQGGIINLSTTPRLDDLVSVPDIYAMEVYPRAASAPARYSGTTSPCGVVLIWTGRGL